MNNFPNPRGYSRFNQGLNNLQQSGYQNAHSLFFQLKIIFYVLQAMNNNNTTLQMSQTSRLGNPMMNQQSMLRNPMMNQQSMLGNQLPLELTEMFNNLRTVLLSLTNLVNYSNDLTQVDRYISQLYNGLSNSFYVLASYLQNPQMNLAGSQISQLNNTLNELNYKLQGNVRQNQMLLQNQSAMDALFNLVKAYSNKLENRNNFIGSINNIQTGLMDPSLMNPSRGGKKNKK